MNFFENSKEKAAPFILLKGKRLFYVFLNCLSNRGGAFTAP